MGIIVQTGDSEAKGHCPNILVISIYYHKPLNTVVKTALQIMPISFLSVWSSKCRESGRLSDNSLLLRSAANSVARVGKAKISST